MKMLEIYACAFVLLPSLREREGSETGNKAFHSLERNKRTAGPPSLVLKKKGHMFKSQREVLNRIFVFGGAAQAKELREHELLAYDTSPPEIQAELWAWVVVRCLALLTDFGIDMLKVPCVCA